VRVLERGARAAREAVPHMCVQRAFGLVLQRCSGVFSGARRVMAGLGSVSDGRALSLGRTQGLCCGVVVGGRGCGALTSG
jgi:hypothetical protein